jgi:hypothetical protein
LKRLHISAAEAAAIAGGIAILIWSAQPAKPVIEPDPWVVVPAGAVLSADALATCQALLDTSAQEGLIRARPSAARINVDDRLWSEISADSKRGVLQAVACTSFHTLTLRDEQYVTAYGHRSGKRLAMLTSAGIAFE